MNLGVGAYRGDDGKPFVLDVVRKAEQIIVEKQMDHEYAGIAGVPEYVDLSLKFAFGENADTSNIAAVQSLSGTGGCRLAGQFISRFVGAGTKMYVMRIDMLYV